jgi:hypothetical protein
MRPPMPQALLDKRAGMQRVEIGCEYCPASDVLVEAAKDDAGLAYLVMECTVCNTAWRRTNPSIVERLVAAKIIDDRDVHSPGVRTGS